MIKSKIKQEKSLKEIEICPDYDEDCKDVIDPTNCFLGFPLTSNIGIADGYCQESRNRKYKG